MITKLSELEYKIETLEPIKMGKTFLFDFTLGDFILENGKPKIADEISGLKVWIEKILKTQKNKYLIYKNTNYGANTEDLIGRTYKFSYIEKEFEFETKEALLQHPDISNITNFTMSQDESTLDVSFQVNLISGQIFREELSF